MSQINTDKIASNAGSTTALTIADNGGVTAAGTLDVTGDVGIGTTSPDAKTHIYSGTGGKTLVLENPNNDYSGIEFRANSLVEGRIKVANDGMHFFSDTGTSSQTMLLDPSGNVGINTTSFGATYDKLAVAGGINIQDDNNAKLEIGRYSSGVPNSYIKLGANSNSLRFTNKDDNADLLTIENGGNVGIGTNDPDCMLHLSGGNEQAKIKFQVGTANADKFKIYASTAGRLYVNSDNGNTGVYLTHNGTSWTSNSDETLKDNITSLGTVGDKLKNYRTSYFTWKADTETPPKRNIGFIAQDWETDFPEVVTKKEGETLGMQYTETIPILLKYIQELEARLTAGGL